MPAQKRPYETSPTPPPPDEKDDDSLKGNQNHDEDADDSGGEGTCIHRQSVYIHVYRFVCYISFVYTHNFQR